MELVGFVTLVCGILVLISILLANYFQIKIMKRFSGLIGKIMFWYSLGLVLLLILTIYNWIWGYSGILGTMLLPPAWGYLGTMIIFLMACICFLKGAMVIK